LARGNRVGQKRARAEDHGRAETIFVVVIALGLVATPLVARAQPRGKTWRVGFLSGGA
jgi:hypothetical protein